MAVALGGVCLAGGVSLAGGAQEGRGCLPSLSRVTVIKHTPEMQTANVLVYGMRQFNVRHPLCWICETSVKERS